MKPKRIIIVRHGESEGNVDPKIYSKQPDSDIVLTVVGREQAAEAGRKIAGLIGTERFGVFVSPYARTLQTLEGICGQLPGQAVFVYQDPRLREQDCGILPAVEEAERNWEVRRNYGRFFYRFPGGESCADVFDRMSTFFETLHRRFQREDFPENILIVSHGASIKCFLARWYHWEVKYFEELPFSPPNCHTVVMSLKANGDDYDLTEPFGSHFFI